MRIKTLLGSTVAMCVLMSATQLVAATEFPSKYSEEPAQTVAEAPAPAAEDSNAVVVESHPQDAVADGPPPEFKKIGSDEIIPAPVNNADKDPIPAAEAEAIAAPVELKNQDRPELLGS